MKTRKISMSVGIPAYNEEENIKKLLLSLVSQKEKNFILKKIIVVSDHSSDKTEEEVKSIKNKRIVLIRNKKRIGQALSQNVVLDSFAADVLVLLNADVLPENKYFLDGIVKYFTHGEADLVGIKHLPISPKKKMERIIAFSVNLKTKIFEGWNRGENLYLCRGGGRAFSKAFLKNFRWPRGIISEDIYSYLFCKKNNFQFKYCSKSKMHYKLPDAWLDHARQSKRFSIAQDEMSRYFSKDLISSEFQIPILIVLAVCLESLFKNPVYFFQYVAVYLASRLSFFNLGISSKWVTSKSTKRLDICL